MPSTVNPYYISMSYVKRYDTIKEKQESYQPHSQKAAHSMVIDDLKDNNTIHKDKGLSHVIHD